MNELVLLPSRIVQEYAPQLVEEKKSAVEVVKEVAEIIEKEGIEETETAKEMFRAFLYGELNIGFRYRNGYALDEATIFFTDGKELDVKLRDTNTVKYVIARAIKEIFMRYSIWSVDVDIRKVRVGEYSAKMVEIELVFNVPDGTRKLKLKAVHSPYSPESRELNIEVTYYYHSKCPIILTSSIGLLRNIQNLTRTLSSRDPVNEATIEKLVATLVDATYLNRLELMSYNLNGMNTLEIWLVYPQNISAIALTVSGTDTSRLFKSIEDALPRKMLIKRRTIDTKETLIEVLEISPD